MSKIDFRKISVKDIEGNETLMDISKELGNSIYRNTPDLGELELAQELYKAGVLCRCIVRGWTTPPACWTN